MPSAVPESLRALLGTTSDESMERAWSAFLGEHSDTLLRVARSLGGDHDAVMDRYTYALDALRRDDFQRLRGFVDDGKSQFRSWLIVVARRLCLDHYRHRYGRPQGAPTASAERHRERRLLIDLIANELEPDRLEDPAADLPDLAAERSDRTQRLQAALARLEPEDRLLLRLRFEDGLSVPEAARAMGAGSPFVLYRRIDRLLAALRKDLIGRGVESPRG